jgi:hypothetical protein
MLMTGWRASRSSTGQTAESPRAVTFDAHSSNEVQHHFELTAFCPRLGGLHRQPHGDIRLSSSAVPVTWMRPSAGMSTLISDGCPVSPPCSTVMRVGGVTCPPARR